MGSDTKQKIERLLDEFPFESAAEIYRKHNMTWYLGVIPNAEDLRQRASELLEGAYCNGTGYCKSGRLQARYFSDDDLFELSFIPFSEIA